MEVPLSIPLPAQSTFPLQSSAQSFFSPPLMLPSTNTQGFEAQVGAPLTNSSAPPSDASDRETTDSHELIKRKRHAKPPPGVLLTCAICGDAASGYNFEAICCESCKAFFRRNGERANVCFLSCRAS